MINKATDVKLNIKPLMGYMSHTEFWEGPCRGGIREEMTPEAEIAKGLKYFEMYKEALKSVTPNINILEPVFVNYNEDFVVNQDLIDKIEEDIPHTDYIMVMYQRIPKIERFGKPVISFTHTVSAADTCAYLRSIGMEAYYPIDPPELMELLHLLWVRKAVSRTRTLVLTAGESPTWGLLSSIRDLEGLRKRFGVEIVKKPFTDIFPVMDTIDTFEARSLAEGLEAGSMETKVRTDWLTEDLRYYLASIKMMEKYGCNAFSTSCVELCKSRIPQQRKFVPCIAHTLNKDNGIPSFCEEDLNAMMAMIMLMYSSGKPAFMGNPLYESDEMISIHHSVPCLKMNGYNTSDLKYSIFSFTGQGFGGKIQIDFSQNNEDEVTLARFDPTGTKMLIKTGKVLRTEYKETYCSPYYYIQMDNVRDYLHNMMDFGHHQALVFGNYVDTIKKLAKIMNFEVVEG